MNDDSRKQDAEGGSCNTRLQDAEGSSYSTGLQGSRSGSCNITIGEVSAMFQVSTRMLRYYEKAGLIKSTRKEGYAYRVYDIANVKKVQQVIITRICFNGICSFRNMMTCCTFFTLAMS